MPTYDYVCDGCGHAFDELQSFSAPILTTCPKCGEEKLRRLFGTGAAILFKGSGFYETDYRSDSYKQSVKSDSDSAKPATPATTPTTAPASTPPASGGGKPDTGSK